MFLEDLCFGVASTSSTLAEEERSALTPLVVRVEALVGRGVGVSSLSTTGGSEDSVMTSSSSSSSSSSSFSSSPENSDSAS